MMAIVMIFMTTDSGLEWRAAGVQGTCQQLPSGALAQTEEHIQGEATDPLIPEDPKSDNNDNNDRFINKTQKKQSK